MKKSKKIIIILGSLFICLCAILVAAHTLKGNKQSNLPKEETLKDRFQNKFIPFGKEFEHGDYSVKIEGVYVNEETLERAFYVIVDGKEDFTEDDYLCTHYLEFHKNEDGSYRYIVSTGLGEGYVEIIEGNIYYYCNSTAKSNINKRENYGEITFEYAGTSYSDENRMGWPIVINLSDGLQYYNVNGNDVVVTNYGIIANQDFEIKTLQVYLQGGESVFESEEVDINAPTTKKSDNIYVYSYKEIDAMKVEYIEVNGEKFYPEK